MTVQEAMSRCHTLRGPEFFVFMLCAQAGVGFDKRRTESNFNKSKRQNVEKMLTFRLCDCFSCF